MNTNRLSARIEARNQANAIIRVVGPLLQAALKPLIGTKVKCVTGARTVKLQKALDSVLETPGMLPAGAHVWINTDRYAFRVSVRVSKSAPGECGCYSEESSFYLGDITGSGILAAVYDAPSETAFRTDFNVDEVLKARHEVKVAREMMQAAEGRLCCFGEFDR